MLHQIGVGALGPVFRTYEPTRDRLVAVKVFRLDVTPEQAAALADELTRATEAGLFHASIVEPVAAGLEGTVAYRAEEYVAAESLDVAMRHYAPATVEKAMPFISQLAAAIDFARAAGVGHGALHPRDIFVTPDEARATGFGVVDALERLGLRAPVRRPYSPPERIAGESWSTPADVFSLAAIAFELLTGRRPSGLGEQMGALTGASLGDRAEAIQAVLAKAMHERPGERYASAGAFVAALSEAAGVAEPVSSADLNRVATDARAEREIGGFAGASSDAAAQVDQPEPDRSHVPSLDDFAAESNVPPLGESAREVVRKVIAARKRQIKPKLQEPAAEVAPSPALFAEAPPAPVEPAAADAVSNRLDSEKVDSDKDERVAAVEPFEIAAVPSGEAAAPDPVSEPVPEPVAAKADVEVVAPAETAPESPLVLGLRSEPDDGGRTSDGEMGLKPAAALREFPSPSIGLEPSGPAVETPLLREPTERVVAVDEFRARETSGPRGERTWPRTPDRKPPDRVLASKPSPIDPIDSEIPLISPDEPKPDRVREVMLPKAVVLIVGLLLGYTAGYIVGSRETAQQPPVAENAAPPANALQTPGTSGQRAGRESTEQAVSPTGAPAAAPPAGVRATPPAVVPRPAAPAAPAPAPRATARTTGQIVVRSTPSKAAVTVNGTWTGRTPLTLENRPFGRYVIRIVQDGYNVAREEFRLSPTLASKTIDVQLQRRPTGAPASAPAGRSAKPAAAAPAPSKPAVAATGVIFIDSRPQGARVFVDGKELGVTPLRVPGQDVGAHTVRLELTDHQSWTTTTRVEGGATARVTGSLDRIR